MTATPSNVGHDGPTRSEPVTPKAQQPSGAVERVVRAGIQLAARVELPDVDNAAAIMEWRAALAALRVAPAATHES